MKGLPHFASGEVIQGFGRGSKELGCPTANYPLDVVQGLPEDFEAGIYFGWASINNGDVHKMVISIGWCPFYHNKQKSMETHIIHKFNDDFYGKLLKVCICGYIRPEKNFDSLDALIATINQDIEQATEALDKPEHVELKSNVFFRADV